MARVNAEQDGAGMDSPLPVVGFLIRQTRLHQYRRQIASRVPGHFSQFRGKRPGGDDRSYARNARGDRSDEQADNFSHSPGRARVFQFRSRAGIGVVGDRAFELMIRRHHRQVFARDAELPRIARRGFGRRVVGKQRHHQRMRHGYSNL